MTHLVHSVASAAAFSWALVMPAHAACAPVQPQHGVPQTAPGSSATAHVEATNLDRLEVTHTATRIPRAGFDTLEPAQVITHQDLARNNLTDLSDAFLRTPSLSLDMSSHVTQTALVVGVSFGSRFGLGSNHLLTLVNGRRFVSSRPPTPLGPGDPGSQVDLGLLPTNFIERVENISIGGAPTYGSDAISGVTNVILRDRFDGVEVEMGYGQTERGDGHRSNISSLFGTGFAHGRGHFVLSLSHDEQQGLPQSARRFFREGYMLRPNPTANTMARYQPGRVAGQDGRLDPSIPFDGGASDGVPAQVHVRDVRGQAVTAGGLALPDAAGLSADPSGRLRGFGGRADQYLQFDSHGRLVDYDPGANFGSNTASGGQGLPPWVFKGILGDLDRKTAYLTGRFDFSERVRGFWELSSHRTMARESSTYSTLNIAEFGKAGLDGTGVQAGALMIPSRHPLLTDQARERLQGFGVEQFRLSRALRDIIPGSGRTQTHLWRLVMGLKGHFAVGHRGFDWEVSGIQGRGNFTYLRQGLVQQNFINALNVVRRPDGRIVCDPAAPGTTSDPACKPLDLFGENRPSRAAREYVTMLSRTTSSLSQTVFNANLTGELVALAGGMMSFNAGYEYRRERGRVDPGVYSRLALGRDKPIAASDKQVHSHEFFGEAFAPLVDPDAAIPGLRRLDLTAKIRRVFNSVNGGFTAYTLGFQYEPMPGVQLRGNKTRSFRAPSLVELYANQGASGAFDEPCEASNIASGGRPAKRAGNCATFFAAYPGVDPATFQGPLGPVPTTLIGDTELRNEQADAWTAGLVLQPEWAPNLRLAFDYQRIDLTDIITGLSAGDVVSGCFDADAITGNPYCTWVQRDPTNATARHFDLLYANGPYLNFRGWTAEASYRLDFDRLGWGRGQLDLGAYAYFPLIWERAAVRGVPADNRANVGGQNRSYQWSARYTLGKWNIGATAIYTPGFPVGRDLGFESQDRRRIDGHLTVDANVGYAFNKRWRMNLAVSDLTDDIGPFPAVRDPLGRRYMLSVTMKL